MSVYKLPVELAIIVFPIIAFFITLPFLIYQYRKFGAIHILKSTIFYSFILYLITAYFLIMLPLPTFTEVKHMTGPTMQLHLFNFIKEILQTVPHHISDFNDLIAIISNPTVYIVIFNIFLTLPYGVYLKYYFGLKWYNVIIMSFFLSLFFELTQLSGLYGIYPRPYRLFDVDDLFINTLGGTIGCLITPLLLLFFPSKEELDELSYKKGQKVTLLRRFVALLIDIVLVALISLLLKILLYRTQLSSCSLIISVVIYYFTIPFITKGQTIGKKVVKIKIASTTGNLKWYQLLFRNIFLVFFTIYYGVFNIYINLLPKTVAYIIDIIIVTYQLINVLKYIKKDKDSNRLFLYEKITHTQNKSIIIENSDIKQNATNDV